MTDARLDNLERRIRTLESELADLRRIVAAEEPGAAPAPPVQVAERPDLRRRLAELDRAREKALWESNRAALLELRELLRELEPELAAAGLDVGATSLASAINQGIRRLAGTGGRLQFSVRRYEG